MFSLYRYKKSGLPHGLIRLHEFLVKDIIEHFEKGKYPKKRIATKSKIRESLNLVLIVSQMHYNVYVYGLLRV